MAKTRAILSDMLATCLQWPGSRVFLARGTRDSLTQTVLTTLEKQVFPAFGLPVPGGAARGGRTVYEICDYDGRPNGSELVPLGVDDPSQRERLKSSEWTKGYVAEVTDVEKQMVLDLGATIRWFPEPDARGRMPIMQIVCDWNPTAPGHWVYQQTEDFDYAMGRLRSREDYDRLQVINMTPAANPKHRWKRVIVRMPDNPGYWDRKAWGNTPMGLEYLDTLGYMNGYQRTRWLDGEPCSADGSVFSEFDPDKNVVNDFQIPEDWPIWLCVDPGYDHPCGVTWNTVAPNGLRFTIAEIKVRKTNIDRLVQLIEERQIGVVRELCDPAGKQERQDNNGQSFITQMAKMGHRMAPWKFAAKELHDASVQAHRQAIYEGRYKVFRSCAETIAEHQTWAFKRVRGGELPVGDDQYEDKNNDLIDGILGWERENPRYSQGLTRVLENG